MQLINIHCQYHRNLAIFDILTYVIYLGDILYLLIHKRNSMAKEVKKKNSKRNSVYDDVVDYST